MKDRLTKAGWIGHGLRALAEKGPGALKIGSLAAGLNVSRGSFYWHFRDLADFRAQLLDSWRERTTERIIRDIEAQRAEPDRLRALVMAAFAAKPARDDGASLWAAEDAIRAWALTDCGVAAIVASVDDRRVAYISELLIATGVDAGSAPARATFLYWAYLGQAISTGSSQRTLTPLEIAGISDLLCA